MKRLYYPTFITQTEQQIYNEPFIFDNKKITAQMNYLSLTLYRIELEAKILTYEEVGMVDPLQPDVKKAKEFL